MLSVAASHPRSRMTGPQSPEHSLSGLLQRQLSSSALGQGCSDGDRHRCPLGIFDSASQVGPAILHLQHLLGAGAAGLLGIKALTGLSVSSE